MAFLYWLHLAEHSDITKEGYVGFTSKTVGKRFKKHVIDTKGKSTRSYTVQNAIRKYGESNIVVTTILEGSVEYCLSIEYRLRPTQNIGWNIGVGGTSTTLGTKRSQESKDKQSAANKGKKISPETALKISIANRGKEKTPTQLKVLADRNSMLSPWENGRANKGMWAISNEIYNYYTNNPLFGDVRVSNYFKCREHSIRKILRHIRNGWVPHKDIKYISWLCEYNKTLGNT